MKFTLSWLKDHVDTQASLEELCDALTALGLEVESVDDRKVLKPFVIAKVLKAAPHPDADKLQILSVDIGQEAPLQIVCGAKNAKAGMKGVLAPVGTYIPGLDITLTVGKIRGVESYGMMCSYNELGLEGDSEGIIALKDDAPTGTAFAEYAGLCDPIIDVSLTPNRADCTSVLGIARDLTAKGLGKLKKQPIAPIDYKGKNSVTCVFADNVEEFCHNFSWCLIRDVQNTSSPQWMQQRLSAAGVRPINAIVDISNYVMLDIGRPLHIFDADKIKGALHIRYAKEGESFLALNNKNYSLKKKQAVIADEEKILCLAGVMGSSESGCTSSTKNILIESAVWDSLITAQTGRALSLSSEARYRFERGVDPLLVQEGLEKACVMITELCGGSVSPVQKALFKPAATIKIPFFPKEVQRLTSLNLAKGQIKGLLEQLGFSVEQADEESFLVTVPSWRVDIKESADLVEEVLRLYGLDKIQPMPLPAQSNMETISSILTPAQARRRLVKRILAHRGMNEALTYAFISHAHAKAFGGGQETLQLANPISADLSDMRPSLLPGLILAAQKNADHGRQDLALFEVSDIYENDSPRGQRPVAAGIRRGTEKFLGNGRFWSGNSTNVTAFDVKEDVFALLEACGLDPYKMQIEAKAPAWYHPGRSGTLKLGPKTIIGYFGQLHPQTVQLFKATGALCAFEIFLDAIPLPKAKKTKTRAALQSSNLQMIKRDFAFLVHKDVPADKILQSALKADKKYIQSVRLFDVFEEASLGDDKKSLAIEVSIQPTTHTLTDKEIEEISGKIIQNVIESTGGILRFQ